MTRVGTGVEVEGGVAGRRKVMERRGGEEKGEKGRGKEEEGGGIKYRSRVAVSAWGVTCAGA